MREHHNKLMSTNIGLLLSLSSCKDSAGYRGGGQSEEKCKESNSWNVKGKEGAEKRSVDRLVLAVSVFVVGARPFDRPDIVIDLTLSFIYVNKSSRVLGRPYKILLFGWKGTNEGAKHSINKMAE